MADLKRSGLLFPLKTVSFRPLTVSAQIYGPLAQSVEQRAFNPLVEGSNPSRPILIPAGIAE